MPYPHLVFGGGYIGTTETFNTPQSINDALGIVNEYKCTESIMQIDTAHMYYGGEELLGQTQASHNFIIDTKLTGGFDPGSLSRERVMSDVNKSLEQLQVKKLGILYLHAPDDTIPIAETLSAVNELHNQGKFTRFGLSNYAPSQVEMVYTHCQTHGYILPSVYQANYSAVSRKPERVLFPLLRNLSMSIYVYSPLSGGFLSKTRDQIMAATGRFDDTTFRGGIYVHMYRKPIYLDALDEWNDIAQSAGCSKADLAYRWVRYHSFLRGECGDAVLFATSSLEQLRMTMKGFKAGPLGEDIVHRVNRLWGTLEAHAPGDTFEAFQSMLSARQA
ncbi:putative aldehyde reductase [Aspergillus caelatus]|uniref:Putative aldehyde reductase n=1 Tax=Aspergillus caelatus TaxID=61420 RepID=A0A5N6ZYZ0_9EURO|nr:putative aldehyde reductase [Aspergillus caelatus]KAE8361510.1 putative aldehyde reductase [Aspergillus caelatus]